MEGEEEKEGQAVEQGEKGEENEKKGEENEMKGER